MKTFVRVGLKPVSSLYIAHYFNTSRHARTARLPAGVRAERTIVGRNTSNVLGEFEIN